MGIFFRISTSTMPSSNLDSSNSNTKMWSSCGLRANTEKLVRKQLMASLISQDLIFHLAKTDNSINPISTYFFASRSMKNPEEKFYYKMNTNSYYKNHLILLITHGHTFFLFLLLTYLTTCLFSSPIFSPFFSFSIMSII